MKLKPIASNMTEVSTEKAVILFSYQTPVAACMNDGSGFIRTSTKWSATTLRHINKWLDGAKAREVEQAELDTLVNDGGAGTTPDERMANARLIAAAPAMYEALKLAHKELDNLRNGIKPLSGDIQRAEVNVRAAIAKATE